MSIKDKISLLPIKRIFLYIDYYVPYILHMLAKIPLSIKWILCPQAPNLLHCKEKKSLQSHRSWAMSLHSSMFGLLVRSSSLVWATFRKADFSLMAFLMDSMVISVWKISRRVCRKISKCPRISAYAFFSHSFLLPGIPLTLSDDEVCTSRTLRCYTAIFHPHYSARKLY